MTTDRDILARQQREALQALLAQNPPPPGMDPAQIQHTAHVLQSKRRHEARLAAPLLAAGLGDSFTEEFDDFAKRVPYPRHGGPAADAALFGDHLRAQGLLPDHAAYEHMMLKARTTRRVQFRVVGPWAIFIVRVRGRIFSRRFWLRRGSR